MEIKHFLKDGRRVDSIDGHILPGSHPVYSILAEYYIKKTDNIGELKKCVGR